MKRITTTLLIAVLANSAFVCSQQPKAIESLFVEPQSLGETASVAPLSMIRPRDRSPWADPWKYWETVPGLTDRAPSICNLVMLFAEAEDDQQVLKVIEQVKKKIVDPESETLVRAKLLIDLGRLANDAARRPLAKSLLQESERLIDGLMNSNDKMVWQERLGSAFHECGDPERASKAFGQAFWNAERMENPMLRLEAIARILSASLGGVGEEPGELLTREREKANEWYDGGPPRKLIGLGTLQRISQNTHGCVPRTTGMRGRGASVARGNSPSAPVPRKTCSVSKVIRIRPKTF